ncbi:MAG TPA: sugar transferase [archaeon]|nr:sugar transferase [archaeon]
MKLKTFSDLGPIHAQVRVGKGGKPIIIRKLRTMKRGAHTDYMHVMAGDHAIEKLKKEDNRVTPVGKFLRKYHIDEVPQIIDWLSGKLTLVGVRPLVKQDYWKMPEDVRKMYKEMGPSLAGLQYACSPFPPTHEQLSDEIRKFHVMWKKNRAKAYTVYGWRIFRNRVTGKSFTK